MGCFCPQSPIPIKKPLTHYDTLGVAQSATAEELKKAYRRLVKIYHPDVNPSPEARVMIRELTEAYEVLSDAYTRNLYDLKLQDPHAYYTYTQPDSTEESEDLRAWRAYRQRKAREERERLDHLILIKIKFYKFQRLYSKVFLVLALVFTLDYYYWPRVEVATIERVKASGESSRVYTDILKFDTDKDLLVAHQRNRLSQVSIYYSSVFDLPVRVGYRSSSDTESVLKLHNTLHTFNNVFSVIILTISIIVIRKRQYEDWALTIAIIPFFLSGFLLLFVASA